MKRPEALKKMLSLVWAKSIPNLSEDQQKRWLASGMEMLINQIYDDGFKENDGE
jgi:hypothetical protein